ncbi:MAG: OsmC family protein [Candidatus Hodarchaeota archaeon]
MLKSLAKKLEFSTTAFWEKEKRGHFTTSLSSEKLAFSCPPEFGGIETPSPEDLFLVSIASCTLTTFLHLCDNLRTEPKSLTVTTEADITFDKSEGRYKFSTIKCIISANGDKFLLKRASELTPKYCLVGRSVKPKLEYEIRINSSN